MPNTLSPTSNQTFDTRRYTDQLLVLAISPHQLQADRYADGVEPYRQGYGAQTERIAGAGIAQDSHVLRTVTGYGRDFLKGGCCYRDGGTCDNVTSFEVTTGAALKFFEQPPSPLIFLNGDRNAILEGRRNHWIQRLQPLRKF